MKSIFKTIIASILALTIITAAGLPVFADSVSAEAEAEVSVQTDDAEEDDSSSSKAIAAAFVIGIAAAAGAIAMGMAVSKSSEGISRQPEAAGSIRTSMMLGLVFIETAIIYALIIAILIIFVL